MNNKVALVTGGSSGIGKATAIAFAKAGANVAIASRKKSTADKALKEIEREGTEAIWIETDVGDAKQVEKMVSKTTSHFGRLDFAFNNGGDGGRGGLTAEMSEENWNKTIQGYLTSTWLCMKYQIPAMLKQGQGAIVNNASVDGVRGYPFPFGSAYSAAKHGVIGLTKSAAKEYNKLPRGRASGNATH
jgi:NAD(P)-dependent dehydrogenase (short-subunit alcohol dehydrogenase family)